MHRSTFLSPLSLAAGLLVIAAAVVMSFDVGEAVHGDYYFRQGHVAANIEKFLDHGLSLVPSTYNRDIPFSVFNFPAYEYIVVVLCWVLGTDPVMTAGAVGILFFLGSAVYVSRITSFCGAGPRTRVLTLLFFSFSPLTLFYFHIPIPDSAVMFLSFLSFDAFLRWEADGKVLHFVLMLASGILATLMKNPVYLAILLAQAWYLVSKRGVMGVVRPAFVLHAASVAVAVVAFKVFSNSVNGVESLFAASEGEQYFGPLRDRLDPSSWARIFEVLTTQALTPVSSVLAVIGAPFYWAGSKSPQRSVMTSLLIGAVVAGLVFFNRHTWHAYYQLPFVLPLSFFAASGIDALVELGKAIPRRLARPWAGVLIAIVSVSLFQARASFSEREATPTEWIAEQGRFIREETQPDDFVIYLLDADDGRDWNPVFLYFADRDGYNLTRARFGRRPQVLEGIRARFAPEYARVLVFCPAAMSPKFTEQLEALGGKLYAAGPAGFLYELRPGG
jgi:hypothetical protein